MSDRGTLCLTVKVGEGVYIGEGVYVYVSAIRNRTEVSLSVCAPKSLKVLREKNWKKQKAKAP